MMNDDDLKRLLGISQSDQATSEWATFAVNIAVAVLAYRRQLVNDNVPEADVLALTENFQTGYLSILAGITAMNNALKGKQT